MSDSKEKNSAVSIYSADNEFLCELAESQQRLTIFVKNGVQIHGTIVRLYRDWMFVNSSRDRDGLSLKEDSYVRYDAISTIKVVQGA